MIAQSKTPTEPTPASVLKSVFGYDTFRPLQEEIIAEVLAKRDTLAIMPTGGGKSLCYQVPALLFPGLTIVVSPLIALMQDQVSQLEAAGVEALFLNSTLDRETWHANAVRVRAGEIKLLYLAPESLVTARVQELLAAIRVDCVTIDEAHCISDWGHDFRPEYRALAEVRALFPHAVCLALTATATAQVRRDIKKNLKLESPAEFVASFNRANIYLEVRPKKNPVHQILDFIEERSLECGIIYCFSRKQVDDLTAELTSRGHQALPYHAGLSDVARKGNQEKFLRDQARIIVATVAFGMGINKPDVRFVIHFDLPKSPEQYYQEIGRAGRDGLPATALLFFSYGDTRKIRFFMEEKSVSETKKAEAHLKAMTDYADARTCRRKILLNWFGEDYQKPDGAGVPGDADSATPCCDICNTPPASDVDVTVPAQKFLSCVVRTGERYGTAYVVDILLGSRQKRIVDNGHHKLSTWGIGRELEKDDWFELARLLAESGYLNKDDEYGVLSLTRDARDALAERAVIMLPFSAALASSGKKTASTGPADKGSSAGGSLKFPKKTARNPGFELDPKAALLLGALKGMRRSLAEAASVPPYVIFSDRTLEDLAVKRPSSREDLLEVYGIGAVKADRYGDYIMQAIRGTDG
jgi:ATP-dependent DNA helicase RecQ